MTRNSELAVAVGSFEETLRALGVTSRRKGLRRPRELGRRAALAAAAGLVWRNALGRLLTRDEVQELLGIRSRQGVSDLVRRGRLLALPSDRGTHEFPAFQLDAAAGRIHPGAPRAVAELRRAFASPFTVASWFVTPQPALDGSTPAEWLERGRPEETLVEAARRTASAAA